MKLPEGVGGFQQGDGQCKIFIPAEFQRRGCEGSVAGECGNFAGVKGRNLEKFGDGDRKSVKMGGSYGI